MSVGYIKVGLGVVFETVSAFLQKKTRKRSDDGRHPWYGLTVMLRSSNDGRGHIDNLQH